MADYTEQKLKHLKDDYQNITQHEEMRSVFSLKDRERVNEMSREERNYHTVGSAKKESLKIGQILDHAEELNLTPEQQTDLILRDNRNKNLILVNTEKWSADSAFMSRIKNGVVAYESMIRGNTDVPGVISQINEVIAACDKYLKRSRSIFIWRWSRYNAVRETRDRFRKEKEILENLGQNKTQEMSEVGHISEENSLLFSMKQTKLSRKVENNKNKTAQKKQQLLDSEVTHLGFRFSDSERMVNVKKSISALDEVMSKPLSKNYDEFSQTLSEIREAYSTMIGHCQTYVSYIESKKKGSSSSGKYRLDLVRDILKQSKNELAAFEMPTKDLFEKYHESGSWQDVLYSVRAIKISESDSSITKMGGGTSTVYKLTENSGKTMFIKAEDRLNKEGLNITYILEYAKLDIPGAKELVKLVSDLYYKYREADGNEEMDANAKAFNDGLNDLSEAIFYIASAMIRINKAERKAGESDQEFKERIKAENDIEVREEFDELLKGTLAPIKTYLSKHYDEFLDLVAYVAKKRNEFGASRNAGISPEETLANRNVSTSRVASRLGIDDIVAKSETILIEKDDKTVTKANSMEGVEGSTMKELMRKAKADGISVKLTPKVTRQFLQLQVFDLICGQIDRHWNNVIVTYDVTGDKEYTIKTVKGIDNDLSFGAGLTNVDNIVYMLKPLVDPKTDTISIPFLPKDFYEKIMAYDPETAAFDQKDIRSEAETDALKTRLQTLQNELEKYVSEGKIKLLDSDSDWEKAADEIVNMKKQGTIGRNYLTEII